jgi:hypothetical protein
VYDSTIPGKGMHREGREGFPEGGVKGEGFSDVQWAVVWYEARLIDHVRIIH